MTALRFFFEYGVDTVLWPDDVDSPLGYPCLTDRLPFSAEIRCEIDRLADRYQQSMDWDDVPRLIPWPDEEREAFNTRARALVAGIRRELPDAWVLRDEFRAL